MALFLQTLYLSANRKRRLESKLFTDLSDGWCAVVFLQVSPYYIQHPLLRWRDGRAVRVSVFSVIHFVPLFRFV
jgi:hypothetical protein